MRTPDPLTDRPDPLAHPPRSRVPAVLLVVLVVTVIAAALGAMIFATTSGLTESRDLQRATLSRDLAALHLNDQMPALTEVSWLRREHRMSLMKLSFANGQVAYLNPWYRWVLLTLPASRWAEAVALQREGERRVRAGETQDEAWSKQPEHLTTPLEVRALGEQNPMAVPAGWSPPQPDCPRCDTAVLPDGTRLAVDREHRTLHLALPLSMLPQALKVPEQIQPGD